jgi:Autographiviridae endonuclease VII
VGRQQYRRDPKQATAKRCSACGLEKSVEEFHRNRASYDGRQPHCKECKKAWYAAGGASAIKRNQDARLGTERGKQMHAAAQRRAHYRTRYGITTEEYETLLAEQGGVCAVCGNASAGKRLAIDHNHDTKEVRGLLCRVCNIAVGHIERGDIPLTSFIEYLTRYKITGR